MSGICEGRVVIVTGAGRGLGRAEALELARQGAVVVVNDLGTALDASGAANGPADEVVDEIVALGGKAVSDYGDVSDWESAGRLVERAVETFGRLDVLVNNAGVLRDRMLANMTADEWDTVIRVHLRGTFAPTRWAAAYWRDRAKASEAFDARVVNTTSASGLYGNPGQTNYGAAKAGIAAFTVIAAAELARYGVTVNAVAPSARTRMTENLSFPWRPEPGPGEFDTRAPENVAPLVAWLASRESAGITGRVFNVGGGVISVAEGWHAGPQADKGGRWDPAELGAVVPSLVAEAVPNAGMDGRVPSGRA